ncbi:MAG: hypothetical protein QG594_2428, partial [Bacteroidota bacterium]|nr:hypothetical protein [Bacteroidota bacterium]
MKNQYKILFLILLIFNSIGLMAKNKEATTATILKKKTSLTVAPITATIAGTTAVCLNATKPTITFTGSGGTAPYTFTYKIDNGAPVTISSTGSGSTATISADTNAPGVFTYTLISVHDASAPTLEVPVTGTAIVTVADTPIVDFTFTNDNSCSGTTMQFNPSVTGSGTIKYSWNFGDGTALSNLQNPTHQFTALGCGTSTFSVVLTINVNGCTVTKTQIITVKQKPNISFTDLNNPFSQDPFNNCSNAASNIGFSISVGNSSTSTCIDPNSYTIDWGDGSPVLKNASFPAAHTYNLIGAYNMVITALGINGCSNSMTYIIKNVTNPSGGIVSPGSTQNLCAPSAPLNFIISNWSGNSLGTLYSIDYGDGSPVVQLTQANLQSSTYYNASNPAASQNFPIPHSYITSNCPNPSFKALLTVSNACGETPSSASNITVYVKPVASFTATSKACLNTNVTFTNTTLTGYNQNCTQNALYLWNFGDGTTSTSTSPT